MDETPEENAGQYDDTVVTSDHNVPEFVTVEPEDDLASICERYGVHEDDVLQLNQRELDEHAQARGFPATYERLVPGENRNEPPTRRVEFRVFAGERLRLRRPAE